MTPRHATLALMILAATTGAARLAGQPATAAPSDERADSLSRELLPYAALGTTVAESLNLRELQWTDEQFQAFVHGLRATQRGIVLHFDAETRSGVVEITRAITEAEQRKKEAEHADDTLQDLVRQLQMQRSPSGLHFRLLHAGMGPRPGPEDTVIVSYSARTVNGTGDLAPLTANHIRTKVSDLIPALQEAVQMLPINSQLLLLAPPTLSFGDGPWSEGVPRGAPLVFKIILEDIVPADTAR